MLEIHFTEFAKETEADEVITEETGIYEGAEPESETEIPRSSESGFTEETEKQNEENQSFEPFETDGNLSFLEGIKAEKLVQELEEEVMPMTSGNTGQVWGCIKSIQRRMLLLMNFFPALNPMIIRKSSDRPYSQREYDDGLLHSVWYCLSGGRASDGGGSTVSQKNWIGYALGLDGGRREMFMMKPSIQMISGVPNMQ